MAGASLRKIAIIGGGVAGFSLAYYLQNLKEQNTAPDDRPAITVSSPSILVEC